MSKRAVATKDVFVKLIVGAGQASPSPPVGPALGSKGVKSMDFCKEFNARTAHYVTGTPIPSLITIRPDRSFTFVTRTPPTSHLLLSAAGVRPGKGGKLRGAGNTAGPTNSIEDVRGKFGASHPDVGNGPLGTVGSVSLKHCYEIAKLKSEEERLSGLSLEGLTKCVVAQAGSMGIVITP